MPFQNSDNTTESLLRKAEEDLGRLLTSEQENSDTHRIDGRQLKAVEHVLQEHELLKLDGESVLELIYVEFIARREAAAEFGRDLNELSAELIEEFRDRFPDLQNELEKLFQVDQAFASLHLNTKRQFFDQTPNELENNDATVDRSEILGRIGDYRLIEEVGRGGMGVVYRATQESLGRSVALKTLEGMQAFDRREADRLRAEAELASKLQHPNIVQIFEVGTFDDVPFFSMEYVAGGNLAEAVGKQPIHPTVCAKLVATIARAVGYAHSQGVVHRDLKPSNILLSPSTRPEAIAICENSHRAEASPKQKTFPTVTKVEPKVGDFGLAVKVTCSDRPESQSFAMGTPSYMAPEQLESRQEPTGPAGDIYSLGAILYDLLAGRPPFYAATIQETLDLVRTEEPISLRKLQPRLPRDLETICLKCLRKDPALRYGSAEELAEDLNRFVERLPIHARPASRFEKGCKWVRRHPTITFLMSSIAVALVVITGLWQSSENNRLAETKARERGEHLIYVGQIAQANQELRSQDIERCRALLNECDPKFRNWEWNYLKNLTYEPIWESKSDPQSVIATALSSDGNRVAIGRGAWNVNKEQSIEVWDIPSNQLVWNLKGHPASEICDVQFSPDGRSLVSSAVVWGKSSVCGKVIAWDLEKGIQRHVVADSNARVARITPDGDSIVVGRSDGTVTLFHLQTGEKIREFRKHKQMVFDLAFGPNDHFVTCSRDGQICVWNRNLALTAHADGMGDTRNIAWSPDGTELRLYNYNGIVRTYSIQEGQFRLIDSENTPEFRFERFAPDGMTVATAEFGLGVRLRHSHDDGVMRFLHGHRGHVRSLAFDGPGTRLATGGSDGSVRVWDIASLEPNTYRGVSKSATVSDVAFHPTRSEIAVAMKKTHSRPDSFSGLPRVEIWDSRTFAIKKTFLGHQDWLTCVRMNDAGTRMISGSHDQTVRIWNTIDEQCATVFDQHSSSILDACFAAPENAASIDANAKFLLWNHESGGIQKQASILDAPIKLAELLPAYGLVAVVSYDNRLVVWDWNQAKIVLDVSLPIAIRALSISADCKWIAIAGEAPKTLLWDFDRLRQSPNTSAHIELDGHAGLVTSLCFSPDCQRLISSGNDETVRIFELSIGKELLKLEGLRGLENLVSMSPDGAQLLRFSQRNFRAWNMKQQPKDLIQSPDTMAEWHHKQARAALQQHNYFAARFHSERAVHLDSSNAKFLDTRTLSHIYSDQWGAAEVDIRNAINAEPTWRRQCMLARALIAQGKISEYQQQCRFLMEMIGDNKEPSIVNGAAWVSSFSPDSGADFIRWIDRLGPIARVKKSSYYWNTLAMLHYRTEQYPESIRCANESMKLGIATSAPFDWILKALCYVEQERLVAQDIDLKQVQEIDPKSKKQSAARLKAIQSQLASLLNWFELEKTQLVAGLESTVLQVKEKSFVIPILLRELQAKMNAAGISMEDEARFQSMLKNWQPSLTMELARP